MIEEPDPQFPSDFFPPGTDEKTKSEYVKKIRTRRNNEALQKKESFRKLDAKTEAADKNRQIRDKALSVLKSGDPAAFFLDQYRRLHLGDENVLRLILLTACCQQCDHSFGIHPALDGVKGSGKSSAVSAALFLLPEEYIYTGTFSAKALYYAGLNPGTIVFSDDTLPDEDMIDILKRSMTAFHEPTRHATVTKDRQVAIIEIPAETVFILTSVGTSIDDQLRDRQVICPVDKNPELDKQYVAFLAEHAKTGEVPRTVTPEIEVCREIMRQIKSSRYRVVVPFADRIEFSDAAMESRRALNLFYDYVWSSAILHYKTREYVEKNGIIHVTATEDDFQTANHLFPQSEYQWGLKLSKREKQVFDIIAKAGSYGIEESRIIETLKVDKGNTHRLLHGDHRKNLAGLADKGPVTYIREFNRDTGRQNNVWTITRELKDGLSSFARLSVVSDTTEKQPKNNQPFKTVI
ncbi:MAG: hypothetical protein A4E35_00559 [Methanoregula sp. PtaU1.Bin051]|nr:MAG: hypothetical protein A4E35_00559 [Methanoregula sp. PtaU1.Bin051]